jgi:molecular chaperone GrpE (heat shock protein)
MAEELSIHHHIHLSRDLERLLRELSRNQIAAIEATKETLMATLDQVLDAVAAEGTKLDSLNVLVDGIRQQLKDALANVGGVTPEMQAKIDQVMANVTANIDKVQEAINENTETPPPEPSTV